MALGIFRQIETDANRAAVLLDRRIGLDAVDGAVRVPPNQSLLLRTVP